MNVGNLFRYGESPNGEDLKVNPSSTRNRSTNVIRKTALEDIRFEFIVNYILLKQRFKYTKQKSFMNILNHKMNIKYFNIPTTNLVKELLRLRHDHESQWLL